MSTIKRSVKISGHSTSVTLEPDFWESLKSIAAERSLSINALISKVDEAKSIDNLSSAIRVYVLNHYKIKAEE